MPKKKRPLDRRIDSFRDSSLIVIACEDKHAVRQYFSRLRAKRVQYKVLPTENGASSPKSVLDRLDQFRKEMDIYGEDEFWICIDADHWISGNHQQNFSSVLRECRQKGYKVAVSNPCFEVWLLLHFSEIDVSLIEKTGVTSSQNQESDSRCCVKCTHIEAKLREVVGGYSKSNIGGLPIEESHIRDAVNRATNLDNGSGDYPISIGTRVHLLLDRLLKEDRIEIW